MESSKRLALSYMKSRPAGAARVLERLPAAETGAVLAEVPSAVAAEVLAEMLPGHAARCTDALDAAQVSAMLEKIAPGHAAAILRATDSRHRKRIVKHLPGVRRQTVELLLSYPTSMVGAWIDPTVFVLRDTSTVGEGRKALRAGTENVLHRVFVLDARRRLIGETDLARLTRKSRGPVLDSADEPPEALRARSSLLAARDHPDWKKHLELPVVNRRDEFVGCLVRETLDQALTRLTGRRSNAGSGFDTLGALTWLGMAGVWTICSDLLVTNPGQRRR